MPLSDHDLLALLAVGLFLVAVGRAAVTMGYL